MSEVTEVFERSIIFEDIIDIFFKIQLNLKNQGNELTFTTDELYLLDSFRDICQQYRSMQQLKMQNAESYNKLLANFINNIETLNEAIETNFFEKSCFENINDIILEKFNNDKNDFHSYKDYVEIIEEFPEYINEFLTSAIRTLQNDL